MILNIETSSKICSVAICHDGSVEFEMHTEKEMEHATALAPFVEECMKFLHRRGEDLEAVAVSQGPGSYTGLRIGLSFAKGLCFSRNIPLIGVPTLEILAVKAMFKNICWEGNELIVPLMDARRMEVYTAVYDFSLNTVLKPQPMILDQSSFSEFNNNKMIFIGDCIQKAKSVIDNRDAVWIEGSPNASDMNVLSEKYMREGKFLDLAYSVPIYLKNFQATVPKNRLKM